MFTITLTVLYILIGLVPQIAAKFPDPISWFAIIWFGGAWLAAVLADIGWVLTAAEKWGKI